LASPWSIAGCSALHAEGQGQRLPQSREGRTACGRRRGHPLFASRLIADGDV
jgi:hypothetical protein